MQINLTKHKPLLQEDDVCPSHRKLCRILSVEENAMTRSTCDPAVCSVEGVLQLLRLLYSISVDLGHLKHKHEGSAILRHAHLFIAGIFL